jgi:hypothetical protein
MTRGVVTVSAIRSYDLVGRCVRIEHNSPRWMASTDAVLSMQECDVHRTADIHLELIEVEDGTQVDTHIPLPRTGSPQGEYVLHVNREVPCRIYVDGSQRWNDYVGYGRTWVNHAIGRGKAVRYRAADVWPFYDHLVLTFNVLQSLLTRSGLYCVHAGGILVNRRGVLFTGVSGSGKSTASCAFLQRGYPALSDERVLLFEADGFMGTSFSDIIKVNDTTLREFFPNLAATRAFWRGGDECYFKMSSVPGWKRVSWAAVDYLMVFQRTGIPDTHLEPILPSRTVEHLFPVTLNPYDPMQMAQKFDFLARFLDRVKCYKVYFGTDMKRFAESIAEVVR